MGKEKKYTMKYYLNGKEVTSSQYLSSIELLPFDEADYIHMNAKERLEAMRPKRIRRRIEKWFSSGIYEIIVDRRN